MRNESILDQILRVALGIAFFLTAFYWLEGGWSTLLYGLGAVLLLTGIVGFCPLYRLMHITTRPQTQ